MSPLLREVTWEACPIEPKRDRELEGFAKRAYGAVPPALHYMAHSPWVARAMVRLSPDQGLLVHLDRELAELVALAVSQHNSCRYCYGVSRALLKILGRSEAEVIEIERQLTEKANDSRTAAALAFARRMARADPLLVAREEPELLAVGFTRGERRDLAYVVAYLEFANRTSTILAVPPDSAETMADQWWARLMRPLIARTIRSHTRRGQPEPAPEGYEGPYAYLIPAYHGSPIARVIRETLEDAWEAPELTRRCKGLLFAVVARALGCKLAAGAARDVLVAEGLPEEDVDNALEHLSSDVFDPVERALVPFARETVWYQPADVQRRAKALLEELTPDQFVAATGTLALANAFCRLGAAVANPT